MTGVRTTRRSGWARVGALIAAFDIGAIALVAPMLVLCEDGDGHSAVESAIALCCSQRQSDAGDANRPPTIERAGGDGCSGSCTDTPLLSGIAATSTKGVAQLDDAAAVASTPEASAAPRFMLAEKATGFSASLPSPHLGRSAVLRI